jgi:hypothetical protein
VGRVKVRLEVAGVYWALGCELWIGAWQDAFSEDNQHSTLTAVTLVPP